MALGRPLERRVRGTRARYRDLACATLVACVTCVALAAQHVAATEATPIPTTTTSSPDVDAGSTGTISGGYRDDVDPTCHGMDITGDDARLEEFRYALLGRSSARERMCRCFPTYSQVTVGEARRTDVKKAKKEPRATPLLSLKEYKADVEEKVAQKQREKEAERKRKEQEEEALRREVAEDKDINSTMVASNVTLTNSTKKTEARTDPSISATASTHDSPQSDSREEEDDREEEASHDAAPAPTAQEGPEGAEGELIYSIGELVIKPEKLTDSDAEQYNYAASFNGAKVVASNKDSKHASAALKEDKDAYYISPCASEKFVTIELSEEVTVTSVVLGNFEFHSSGVREFEIWGTSGHHSSEDGWSRIMIGRADNSRSYQKFNVPSPLWLRYVQIKIIGHHENQHFCTLSLLRVHGKDAKETLKEEMERFQAEVQEVESLLSNEDIEEDAKDEPITEEEVSGAVGDDVEVIEAKEIGVNATVQDREQNHSAKTTGEKPSAEKASNVEEKISVERNHTENLTELVILNMTNTTGTNLTNTTTVVTSKPNIPITNEIAKGAAGDANVFRLLAQKMKDLELNQSLLSRYVESLNARYGEALADFSKEIDAIEESVSNSTGRLDEATRRAKASSNACNDAVARVTEASEKIVAAAVKELDAYRRAVTKRDTVLALALALTAGALMASRRSSGILERILSVCSSFALLVIVIANLVLIAQNWLRQNGRL